MPHIGKIFGIFTAGIMGSLIFLAPDTFSGNEFVTKRLTTGSLPVDMSQAEPAGPISRQLSKMEAAEDAYFETVIALGAKGESPERLAKREAAGDALVEAVVALELTAETVWQLARLRKDGAADVEWAIARNGAVDPTATASIAPAARIDGPEDKMATATLSKEAAGKKSGAEPVTVASNAPAAPAATPAKKVHRMPAPQTRKTASRKAKPVRSARLARKPAPRNEKPAGPIRMFYRVFVKGLILAPAQPQ